MSSGTGFHKNSQILPDDFIYFLSKNYKTINDIEQKIHQFQNDPWNDFYKKLGCRNWRNMRLRATKCDSVDSCFSDKDIKKVIRARLKPKMNRVESNEQIDVDDNALQQLTSGKKNTAIDYTYLSQNFPLTYFAPDLCKAGMVTDTKNVTGSLLVLETQDKTVSASEAPIKPAIIKFMVEGNRFPLKERSAVLGNLIESNGKIINSKIDRSGNSFYVNDYSLDEGYSVPSARTDSNGYVIAKNESLTERILPPRPLLTVRALNFIPQM